NETGCDVAPDGAWTADSPWHTTRPAFVARRSGKADAHDRVDGSSGKGTRRSSLYSRVPGREPGLSREGVTTAARGRPTAGRTLHGRPSSVWGVQERLSSPTVPQARQAPPRPEMLGDVPARRPAGQPGLRRGKDRPTTPGA